MKTEALKDFWGLPPTPSFASVFIFLLVLAAAAPAAAQQTATICNAGKVPVVGFIAWDNGLLAEDWNVESANVAPGKCGDLAFGTMTEFYLGFGVTVSGRLVGQPADNLPDSGTYRGAPLVQRATKHVCLLRTGTTNYHYEILEPNCATLGANGPNRGQYVSVDTALFVRTGWDPRREFSGLGHTAYTVAPTASDPRLRLTRGMPDGVEEARAAENDARVQALLDEFLKALANEAGRRSQPQPAPRTMDERLEDMARERAAADTGAPWNLPKMSLAGPVDQSWYGKDMMISGTISSIDVHGQFPTWITVYLKESPDNAIVICSAAPDIFAGRFGRSYATSLVGKTIEVKGGVRGALCDRRAKASIQITMSEDLRIR